MPFTPIVGWLVGLGYFAMTPLAIVVLHGGYEMPAFYQANERYASVNLSDVRYIIPVLVVWLALFLAFQAAILFTPAREKGRTAPALPLNDQKVKRAVILTLIISIVDCAFSIWRSGGLEQFLVSHWYLRQEEAFAKFGDLFVLYAQASLANEIVFTAAAALFTARVLRSGKSDWRMFGLIGFGLILELVMSGNRIFIALYGFSFLIACWMYGRKRLIAILTVLSPLVLLAFSAWGYLRHDLSKIATDAPTFIEQDLDNRVVSTLMDTTEGSSILQLLHMVNDFGNRFEFFYGLTYTKAVTFFLPRSVYPNKPENYPVQIARLYEPGEVTSLGTTQLGELYANFGILSVLLLPLFTILILRLSLMLTKKLENHCLLLTVLFLLSISFARTSFEDNFVTFVFTILILRVLRLERELFLPNNPTRLMSQPA